MDSFISTMETNALMGMNVAQLIVDDYLQILEEENVKGLAQVVLGENGKGEHMQEL